MKAVTARGAPALGRALPRAMPGKASAVWPYALIGLLVGLHLTMALWRGINWDEFWFYNQVQVVARGEWIQPLQTIHTRALIWLSSLPGNSIEHIIVARMIMMAFLAVIAAGIYATAKAFTDHRTALLSVAVYLGAGFVLQHATSFRVDPIVTAFLTAALAIAARTRLRWPSMLALGALIGMAAMVTIKMVLWVPVFAGIALWRWHDVDFDRTYPLRWVAAALVSAIMFAALYTLHSSGASPQANASATNTLSFAGGKMFGLLHSPYLAMLGKAAAISIPLALAALLAPPTVMRLQLPLGKRIALLGLWVPLLTPLFYHNSAPYVYVFLLPPVAIVSALALRVLVERYGETLVMGFIALNALAVWVVDERRVLPRQQALIEAVHKVVPEKVHYFDCCGMMGSYTKANEFLTFIGTLKYFERGHPEYVEGMANEPVPLLIDNNRNFTALFDEGDGRKFLAEDAKALGETYPLLFTAMRLGASRRELDATAACGGVERACGTAGVCFTAL
ncbi:glycosyltransferase family 39 protein [Erythrobacter sp. HL-111]|uniref:ArnT family glycosyltransferase n=1 Tax=Erythrobacter sp. HL-111 TaxID=1798193 RepID=UPI00087D3A9A|nr:hypothetical protein [Erythrobacter sp. HL-111]SDR69906.1 hypothetical protein SAMN04515621_0116 [Erythrobacter sp. HL-111]